MANHSSMNTNTGFGRPNKHVDYYDTFGGKLKVLSDFNGRVMSFDELTTLTDIIVAVNKVYRNQHKTLTHVTLDSVHLYGNCNHDNDIAVIYRRGGSEQFEIRYCSPCANWFVSYCYVNGDGTIETNNRITNLQLTSNLTAENVVEWLFNTMSILDY